MTSDAVGSAPHPAPRKATRRTEGRILGGVAAGLADHLGVDVRLVRGAFLLSVVLGGFGIALYAGLWMILPSDARLLHAAPGIEAATRQGKRPRRGSRLEDSGWLVALGALGLGLVVLAQLALGHGLIFWPILLGLVGLAVLWRQADEAQRERWADSTGRLDPVRAVVGSGRPASYARLAAGVALLAGALTLFAVQTGDAGIATDVLTAGLLGVVGLALTVGPWLFRLASDLAEERAARVRSQERADVAAHLHDSVLQTLALIQKHAGDERAVATLARAQERDLRAWLYDAATPTDTTLAGALRATAADVEDTHGVAVEVVTVGDTVMRDQLTAVVLAAREAMVNAAKHARVDQVDVYAESTPERVEVFVRDRGRGFDPAGVPDDRLGVRRSIVDRMQRHAGQATVRSLPGEGTEVHLSMPVPSDPHRPEERQ